MYILNRSLYKILQNVNLYFYRYIIHGTNIWTMCFIQFFTPKTVQNILNCESSAVIMKARDLKRPALIEVHKPCDTVTTNVSKDWRRSFDPRTPHSSCFQGWATQNSVVLVYIGDFILLRTKSLKTFKITLWWRRNLII